MYNIFECRSDVFYGIKKERNDFFSIYFIYYESSKFITHRTTLKQAQKLCKLLKMAYTEGFEDAKDIYNY